MLFRSQGVKFNGSTSKIAVSDPVVPNGACSISFWYNPSGATGSSSEYILGCGGATASKGVTVYWYNQSFGAMVLKGSSSLAGSANGTGSFPTTDWYNVVFTWDGSTNSNAFKVYVNGVLNAQGTSDTSSASIGTYTDFAMGLTTSNPASGKLDQVRIFNTVLTQSQIRELNRGNYNLYPYGHFDPGTTAEGYIKSGYLGRNTNGSIESQISANQDAGFSIVKYVGNGTAGATLGHGLSSSPQLILVKNLDVADNWAVYNSTSGATKYMNLNQTYGVGTATSIWNDTEPTSTVFSVGTSTDVNGSGNDLIAYCWHSVPKYSKIGSYTGNGSTTGPIVSTGFKVGWIMIKRTDSSGDPWVIFDSQRSPTNPRSCTLRANAADAEHCGTDEINFYDDGFQPITTWSGFNASGGTYIYITFA